MSNRRADLLVSKEFLKEMLILPDHVELVDAEIDPYTDLVKVTLESEKFPEVPHNEPNPIAAQMATRHMAKVTTELKLGDTIYCASRSW